MRRPEKYPPISSELIRYVADIFHLILPFLEIILVLLDVRLTVIHVDVQISYPHPGSAELPLSLMGSIHS